MSEISHLPPTRLRLDGTDVIAPVDPRLFGGFVEHMGRCVYEGIYDPRSEHADEHGCRSDVLAALRRLDMTAMRYPGGNFVSGYNWRDGVGPRGQRPERVERAWKSIETNQFGTDDFLALSERMGWTPMMAVNLGDGSPYDAQDLIAYTNQPAGSYMGDRRAANGRAEPYGVELWCLGNEMDGFWQIGHTSASEYTRRARRAADLMREVDPAIEVVACGSSDPNLPNHPAFLRSVLDGFGDGLDYVSLHRYARKYMRRTPGYLAFGILVDRQIEEAAELCRAAQQRHGFDRPSAISFDEWNVWWKTQPAATLRSVLPRPLALRLNGRAPHLIEEVYNLEDALVCAGFLNSFIRHADVVRIANLAQVANVIAPLLTRGDDLLAQSIYHAFAMFSTRRTGDALRVQSEGPDLAAGRLGRVPALDVSAIAGPGAVHLFAVNRSTDRTAPLEVTLDGIALDGSVDAEVLAGDHPKVSNTFERPDTVVAAPFTGATTSRTSAELLLPPLSLVAASFGRERST